MPNLIAFLRSRRERGLDPAGIADDDCERKSPVGCALEGQVRNGLFAGGGSHERTRLGK